MLLLLLLLLQLLVLLRLLGGSLRPSTRFEIESAHMT
jgi:hypothetical protein